MTLYNILVDLWGKVQNRYINAYQYFQIPSLSKEYEAESLPEHGQRQRSESIGERGNVLRRWHWRFVLLCILLIIITSWASFVLYTTMVGSHSQSVQNCRGSCCDAPKRIEWRSLSPRQQYSYINAARCLQRTPSLRDPNVSRYDDFPWVHRHIGAQFHASPGFLPWHRYFISIFEQNLRDVCGYKGTLPYWDWTTDWVNPAQSSLFDPKHGFGGDGDHSRISEAGGGYCVGKGPFANYTAAYWSNFTKPHCFSRNFTGDTGPGQFSGETLHPDVIERISRNAEFSDFEHQIEMGPHNALPDGVQGDWGSYTAPAEPLFWLHHSQLDRLWWLWQRRGQGRFSNYNGEPLTRPGMKATANDIIPMGSLGRNVTVAELFDTESEFLCYTY